MGKQIEIKAEITEYETAGELEAADAALLSAAEVATGSAYAPYSRFRVGAAVLLNNGSVIAGNNQENVAYPSGLCAERVALFYAGARHPQIPVKAIAITAKSDEFELGEPLAPCGACRQVLVEYEQKQRSNIRIILQGQKGRIHVINSVNDILPFSFSSGKLKAG